MEVVIQTKSEEEIERCDYRDAMVIYIDGKQVFSVRDDEPEDSNLGRSFSDCYGIGELLERAYDAGVKGEGFSLVNERK
jgi:hypothetical protein